MNIGLYMRSAVLMLCDWEKPTWVSLGFTVRRLELQTIFKVICVLSSSISHLTEVMTVIATNLPKIEDLGLYGSFQGKQGSDSGGIMVYYSLSLISVMLKVSQNHLGVYKMFKHLRTLSLPGLSSLGMELSGLAMLHPQREPNVKKMVSAPY